MSSVKIYKIHKETGHSENQQKQDNELHKNFTCWNDHMQNTKKLSLLFTVFKELNRLKIQAKNKTLEK